MSRNIKDYDSILSKFLFVNAIILLLCNVFIDISVTKYNEKLLIEILKNILTHGIGMIIASIIAYIINGIFKPQHKDVLVFWKLNNNLPSYRVFSDLIYKDKRIDIELLKSKYGELPKDLDEQNKFWYSIHKKYSDSDEAMLLQSHRDYLLSRDLTILSFFLMVEYLILMVIGMFLNLEINFKCFLYL